MAILKSAADLWEGDDSEYVVVECPEWKVGGEPVSVRLRSLNGTERDQYEASLMRTVKGKNGAREMVPNLTNSRARLVALTAVNEDGGKLFFGEEAVLKLGLRNAKALDRLWQAACELSGLDFTGHQEDEKAEDFDDDQSEDSTSG